MADVRLRSVKFPGLTDKYVVKDYDDDIETISEDLEEAQTALETKAEIDGYYDEMAVGSAEQLIGTVTVEDKVPYKFRTAGGSADIGNRETDTIVGGTVAWNQLIVVQGRPPQNSVYLEKVDNTSMRIYGTATGGNVWFQLADSNTTISNHVYYADKGSDSTLFSFNNDNKGVSTGVYNRATVGKATQDKKMYFYVANGTEIDVTVSPMLIDLTQLLGTTIADYIYSLEQSTAGTGVAWFRKLFPLPYYAYNAGELKHVEGLVSHDMTGFNQWDEEWESGAYNQNDGSKITNSNMFRCKNKIKILPNTSYYFECPTTYSNYARFCFFDADENFISYIGSSAPMNNVFTTPSNAQYMVFWTGDKMTSPTYNHDVCINLHWDGERDGEYEAYVKHSYPLDDSIVLRGLMKLDANNQPYYYGDTYQSDGTVKRYFGIVDLGTLTWSNNGEDSVYATITEKATSENAISNRLVKVSSSTTVADMPNNSFKSISGNNRVAVKVSGITVQNAATTLSGVMLLYELATPTTEQAEPYTNPQIVDDFGTEEYVTESIVPVGHETYYMNNLRAKLEMAPASPDSEGDYVVRHENGENSYVPLIIPSELPDAPGSDGTYVLNVTVASGEATYSWEEET